MVSTLEILDGDRSPLLEIRPRTAQLDDLVVKALCAVRKRYLESSAVEPPSGENRGPGQKTPSGRGDVV